MFLMIRLVAPNDCAPPPFLSAAVCGEKTSGGSGWMDALHTLRLKR